MNFYVRIAGIMTKEAQDAKQSNWEKIRFNLWLYGLHFLAVVVLGVSLFPMVYWLHWVWKAMAAHSVALKIFVFSCSVGFGYFLFGTALIFSCVLAKNLFRFRIKPGLFRMYSKEALHWMGYNSLILIVNGAFLDVLRISPFQALFYRLMGARVGQGVNVNTAGLADLALLDIGDNVLVGGGVALICHAFDRGFLRLESTKLGSNVSIGLGSVIMPGCEIGDGASIAPCSFMPKGSKIPAKGVWGGNPVKDLRQERREQSKTDL